MSDFEKSSEALKKIFRKGSIKIVGETESHVQEVKRKGTGTEVTVNIKDTNGEGEVVLRFWGPNKKTKETTIQINSRKGSEKRFVKLFADNFVKETINKITSGVKLDSIFVKGEARLSCTVCKKTFAKDSTLEIHMKNHVNCNKCKKSFKEEGELKRHRMAVHISKKIQIDIDQLAASHNKCEDCEYIATSRKSLMVHKEEKHIGDSWLVNTKRDESMMNSKNEHLVTKTKEPDNKKVKQSNSESEAQLKNLSKQMDEKIYLKRRLEEEREISWQKKKENASKLREEENKKEKLNEKAVKQKNKLLSKQTNNLGTNIPKQNESENMFVKNKPKNNKSLPDNVKQVLGDDENELELVKIPGN